MRVAIIDLGTNTFNLLIADVFHDQFKVVFTTKIGVALGMGSIHQKKISNDAKERAYDAFYVFNDFIRQFHVDKVRGIATSMVRDATNGMEFVADLKRQFDIQVDIISGEEEADLILKGVSWLYDFSESALVMDIGGGSTEFIFKSQTQFFDVSLDIGVSRIYQMREWSDPLSDADQLYILDYLEKNATELSSFPSTSLLIGASGSFETFYEMRYSKHFPESPENMRLKRTELDLILDWILLSTQEERESHPFIIPIRKRLAPIAALKTRWILEKFSIQEVLISPYSLKEGALVSFSESLRIK
jgi:exopolyphosphatase / guanosine-5'-triphosphate,3'-diphosphate pyrophosphatase